MERWRHLVGPHLFIGALVALLVLLSGCADDMYAECQLSQDCTSEGGEVSCVEEQALQCETRICAVYRDSTAFCTVKCQSDGDCVAGQCKEFPFGMGTKYCVEDTDA